MILSSNLAASADQPSPVVVRPPQGGQDAGPLIRQAIAQSMENNNGIVSIVLEPGIYRVAPAPDTDYVVSITNAEMVVIRGTSGKTELIVTDPTAGGLMFKQCNNLTLSGITIDYDPAPFTQGRVVAVDQDARTFDLAVDDGMPIPDEPWFASAGTPISREGPESRTRRIWGMFLEPDQRRPKTLAHDHFFMESWKRIDEKTWRMLPAEAYREGLLHIETGDRFALLARRSGGAAIMIHSSTNVLVEDVTVHAAVSLASAVVRSENIAFRRFAVRYRPDTNRLITTNADGIHCQGNRTGPLIENCFFEGMADDSINIYAPPNIVHEVLSDTKVLLSRYNEIRPGDRLQIIDPRQGVIRAEVTAQKVETSQDRYAVTFDRPISGIVSGKTHTDSDTVYNLSASGAGYVIRNNTMRLHRRHGMLLRAGNGLIENNRIDAVAGHGIVITNEPDWPEGPFANNIIIRNNTIRGVGYARHYADSESGGAINIQGTRLGHQVAQGRPQRNIKLIGNTIRDLHGAAIRIAAAQNVELAGNNISADARTPSHLATAAIILDNVDRVTIADCTVTDPRQATTAGVLIRDTVAQGEEALVITNLQTDLHETATPIIDQR